MLARIAGRLTAVVGIAGDLIKFARRLGFENWERKWNKLVSMPEPFCFGFELGICKHSRCTTGKCVKLCILPVGSCQSINSDSKYYRWNLGKGYKDRDGQMADIGAPALSVLVRR